MAAVAWKLRASKAAGGGGSTQVVSARFVTRLVGDRCRCGVGGLWEFVPEIEVHRPRRLWRLADGVSDRRNFRGGSATRTGFLFYG